MMPAKPDPLSAAVDPVQRLFVPPGRLRTVLDTDTYNEIDDQFALTQIVMSPQRFDLEAVYAAPFHNQNSSGPGDGMERSYDEILRLLDRLSIDSRGLVHKGVTNYVGRQKTAQRAAAVVDLIERARSASHEQPLIVVAIAAISNIASALLIAPDIADRIVVVWLGGHALSWPHNREFNLVQDIGGAQVLFDSGAAVVQVPCNGVASHLHAGLAEIERFVEPCGEIGRFLAMRFRDYVTERNRLTKEIWDMAGVAWLLDPEWAPSYVVPATKLTDDGYWAIDNTRHLMRIVYELKRDLIMGDFYGKLQAFAAATPDRISRG